MKPTYDPILSTPLHSSRPPHRINQPLIARLGVLLVIASSAFALAFSPRDASSLKSNSQNRVALSPCAETRTPKHSCESHPGALPPEDAVNATPVMPPQAGSPPPPGGGNGLCSGTSQSHLLGQAKLRCGGDCNSAGQSCKQVKYTDDPNGSYWVCACGGEGTAEPSCCHLRLWADFSFTVSGTCPPCGAAGICTLTTNLQPACLNPPRPPAPKPRPSDGNQGGAQQGGESQ